MAWDVETVADWGQIDKSSIGDSPPISSIHSPTVIGQGGILAILGYEHNLLQITSYDVSPDDPAIIARAYIPPSQQSPDHLSEQFLFLSQNRDDRTNLGWGLCVEPPAGCHVRKVERGFIDSQQPTRMKYAREIEAQNDGTIPNSEIYVEKLTSYVKDGSLVQAMVVASKKPDVKVTWKIGGKIQLVPGQSSSTAAVADEGPLRLFTYSVQTSHYDRVLTLTCKTTESAETGGPEIVETNICLDVSLFINWEAWPLNAQDGQVTAPFVDISQTEALDLPDTQDSICLVSIISLRNPARHPNPTLPQCPKRQQLRRDLMVEDKPMDQPIKTLAEALKKRTKLHLREIPNIIARAVGRALNSLVTVAPEDEILVTYPIQNALHGYPLKKDVDLEECFWLLRFLTLIRDNFQTALQDQIERAICGLLVNLFWTLGDSWTDAPKDSKTDDYAYAVLGLCLARKYMRLVDRDFSNLMVYDAVDSLFPRVDRPREAKDPTTRLLQWAHITAIEQIHKQLRDELSSKKEAEAQAKAQLEGLEAQREDLEAQREDLEAQREDLEAQLESKAQAKAQAKTQLEDLEAQLEDLEAELADQERAAFTQQYYDLALDRTDLRLSFSDDTDLDKENSWQDLSDAVIREEKWIKIALLAMDLFTVDTATRLLSLADEIYKRVTTREKDLLGKIPPWGLRFRDHAVHIELAAMKAKWDLRTRDAHDVLRDAFDKLSYFRLSDLSILSCASDTAGPGWASDLFALDSVIACCSLLSLMVQDIPERGLNRDNPGEEEASPLVDDIGESARKRVKFPWRKSFTHVNQYYPRFIRMSLEGRQWEQDRMEFENRHAAVQREDEENMLVRYISPKPDTLFTDIHDAGRWSLDDLKCGRGRMCVLDFPFRQACQGEEALRELLSKNRVGTSAAQRFIVVDYLPKAMMVMYLFFTHPEAWDTIVDYFSWKLNFRGSVDGVDSHDSAGDVNWHTAITIPHFLYETNWAALHAVDLVGKLHAVLDMPKPTVIVEVCTSVCITGDALGLFWTSSMLGTGTVAAQANNENPDQLGLLQIGRNMKQVMQRFRYDKSGARSLVFVVQLAAACHIVSDRLERVMKEVKAVLDLENSMRLYQDIIDPSFTKSRGKTVTATKLTKALQKALWGVNWLGKLEKSVTSALSIVDEATEHIEMRLSKRRIHWDETLQEYEQEIVENYRRARHRLVIFQNRVRELNDTATNVKDTLISLTDMSMTRAVLATTIDTSQMRILAGLTAVFLPFTLVAVFLTIPMFKWPEPPDGQLYYKYPLIIYFSGSTLLTVLTGLFMTYYSDEGIAHVWQGLKDFFAGKNHNIWDKARRRQKLVSQQFEV